MAQLVGMIGDGKVTVGFCRSFRKTLEVTRVLLSEVPVATGILR